MAIGMRGRSGSSGTSKQGRVHGGRVALLGLLGLVSACASDAAPTKVAGIPEPPSAIAEMVGVRLQGLRWGEASPELPGSEQRFALLLGGGSGGGPNAESTSAQTGFVEANLQRVREVLTECCHVAPNAQTALSGEALDAAAVQAAIADVVSRAKSPELLLMVYLSGQAVVDERGEVHYLTAHSRQRLDGQWEGSLTRAQLAGWLSEASEQVAEGGNSLRTVLVTDVVRPARSIQTPGVALQGRSGWELHASEHGRAGMVSAVRRDAAQDGGARAATPFTEAFVQSLESLAKEGRAAPVSLVLERTRSALVSQGAGHPTPELVRPESWMGQQPRLVAPRRISCSVVVLDALNDEPVRDAHLSVDSMSQARGDGPLPMAQLPGRHLLRVSAPGFLTRVEEFVVDVERSGRPLEVRLLPNLVQVKGWVSPPGNVTVSVDGLPESAIREGFHVVRATASEDGSFQLRLPAVGPEVKLVVSRGSKAIVRKPLPVAPERYLNGPDDVLEGLGLMDLGPVRMPDGHPMDLLHAAADELERAGGAGALPVPSGFDDPSELVAPVWFSEQDSERWKSFRVAVKAFDWNPALAHLEALSPRMDPTLAEAWRGWVELKVCADLPEVALIEARRETMPSNRPLLRLALTSRVLAAYLERASAWASTGDAQTVAALQAVPLSLLDDEVGPYRDSLAQAVEQRSYGIAATLLLRLAEESRWTDALDAMASLGANGTWGTLAFVEMRREALAASLEAELDTALGEGLAAQDWRRSDRILNWMTLHGERLGLNSTRALLAFAERIAVERVPADVHELYEQAQGAFLEGQTVEADVLYGQLEGRMRERYTDYVLSQRDRLGPQLYVRHAKEAESLELEGRLDEAAAAYGRALSFDRRAAADLLRLGRATPGVQLVTADGRAGYSDIGSALAQSLPGAAVLVGPGVYTESLTLKGSRVLLGVGGDVDIVSPSGAALSVEAGSDVEVSGVTLRSRSPGVATVRLQSASLLLDACRIVPAQGGSAVHASGKGALAQLRRCEIPAAAADGLTISDEARLEMTGCAVGLPGREDAGSSMHRFLLADVPRSVRVTDCVFGRDHVQGPETLSAGRLARIQRSNTLRVEADQEQWPSWALRGLTHTTTVTRALELAEAGATIRVAPGLYRESLRPSRSVRLVADSPNGEAVVVDAGTKPFAMRLDAPVSVYAKGLTFRLSEPASPRQLSEAVSVRDGQLELEDCRIETGESSRAWRPRGLAVGNASFNRVGAASAGASSVQRTPAEPGNARAADGSSSTPAGEETAQAAEGSSDSSIEAPRLSGSSETQAGELTAALEKVASVVLRRCRITSSALGVSIDGAHEVTVWDSEIIGRVAGVRPRAGGRADLVATTIRGCEKGVQLDGPLSLARLEACVLSGNQDAWVLLDGATEAQLSVTATNVR